MTVDVARGLTPVTLVVDGTPRRLRTSCATVGEMLDDLGVAVGEWDRLAPDREALLRAGMIVSVARAVPVVVVADGARRTLHTHSRSVKEILEEAGVTLRPGDELWVNGRLVEERLDGQGAADSLSGTSAQGPLLVQSLSLAGGTEPRAVSTRGGADRASPPPISHIEIKRATLYYVHDGGIRQALRSTQRTVGQALHEGRVLLYAGDRVYPDLNTLLAPGLHVRIQRGVPVSIAVDARVLRTRTLRPTVGEVLAELGVALVGKDYVEPALDAEIRPEMRIRVVRVVEKTVVEQEQIPFETDWVADASLELDHRRVDEAGHNGLRRRRYRAVYEDGQEVERYLEDDWSAREPETRRISYGTRIVVRTLDTPEGPIEYWRRIRVFLTSYTEATCGKSPGDPTYGITRLGWKMRHGIIAVDPQVIRLRSQLYVPGYGPGVAGDTGGLITGRHIDLGHDVDNFVMYFQWAYVYVRTPVLPSSQISWILPDFPQERADGGVWSFR